MGAVSRTITITWLFAAGAAAVGLAACGRETPRIPVSEESPPSRTDPRQRDSEDGMPVDWGEGEDDICGHVLPPADSGQGPDSRRAVRQLLECARAYWDRFEIPTRRAFLSYKLFDTRLGEDLPSFHSIRQLRVRFAAARDAVPLFSDLTQDERARLRSRFTREHLEEFLRLSRYRWEMLSRAEIQILRSLHARRAWLEPFKKLGHLALLLEMETVLDDPRGNRTAKRWQQLETGARGIPALSSGEWEDFTPLLHPYAMRDLLPRGNQIFEPLARHPYDGAREEREKHLAGDLRPALEKFESYLKWAAVDNPGVPPAAPFAPNRVRVAMVNAGVDFLSRPEFRAVLSPAFSSDFADLDANPWAPAEPPVFASGTLSALTLLTVVEAKAPQLIEQRRVEVGIWKTSSLRELLGGGDGIAEGSEPLWGNRRGAPEAVLEALAAPSADRPSVVALDGESGMTPVLEKLHDPKALKKAPWLWVVQAGKRAARGDADSAHCWQDLPAESRPADQLLCVGTVKTGPLTPNGARDVILKGNYHGPGIDLYEYAGYRGSCDTGFSCSASQIAAAATILQAAYPKLTAALIRRVLLETAWTQELPVEGSGGTQSVKVFHASSMIGSALERARRYAGQ